MTDSDEINAIIAIWERSIDTQKHFNDLSLRTRQLGVTIVGAMLGVGFVVRTGMEPIRFGWFELPVLSVLCTAAAAMMYMTKLLDVDVYHKMLQGAVAFNEDLEREHLTKFLNLPQGLSQTISVYSRFKDASRRADEATGIKAHDGYKKESLKKRMARFYHVSAVGLLIIGVVVAISGNIGHAKCSTGPAPIAKPQTHAQR